MFLYRIVNVLNNKVYIGKTTVKIKRRWNNHKSALRTNRHLNPYLQHSWNKYGEDAFFFEVISSFSSIEELNKAEIAAISSANSTNREFGYNVHPGGEGGPINEATRLKISQACKGKKISDITRKRMSAAHKGVKKSDETRKRISVYRKNMKFSEETKLKLSMAHKGKKHTEETKAKMRKSQELRRQAEKINNVKR